MEQTAIGIFHNWAAARRAVEILEMGGFTHEQISVIAGNQEQSARVEETPDELDPIGTYTGATVGGAVGAAGGWAIGLAALAIPGIGPIVAAGPILGALAGLAAGAGVGGVIGNFLESDASPEHEADALAAALERGEVVLVVHAEGNGERARELLESAGARQMDRQELAAVAERYEALEAEDAGLGTQPSPFVDEPTPETATLITSSAVPLPHPTADVDALAHGVSPTGIGASGEPGFAQTGSGILVPNSIAEGAEVQYLGPNGLDGTAEPTLPTWATETHTSSEYHRSPLGEDDELDEDDGVGMTPNPGLRAGG